MDAKGNNLHRQGWKGSMLESVFNVGLGFGIALAAWHWLVRPLIHGGVLSVDSSFWITCIFTVISLLRGFVVRRLSVALGDWRERRAGWRRGRDLGDGLAGR